MMVAWYVSTNKHPYLERDERARLRERAASVVLGSAKMARPVRRQRGHDRLVGAPSSERPPANKHFSLACSAAKEFDNERVLTALRLADPERDGCWAQHLDR
jgi:hypothetical protein